VIQDIFTTFDRGEVILASTKFKTAAAGLTGGLRCLSVFWLFENLPGSKYLD